MFLRRRIDACGPIVLALAAAIVVAGAAAASDEPRGGGQALLDDLENDLLEGLDDLLPPPAAPADDDDGAAPAEDADPLPPEAGEVEADNLFLRLGERMRSVERRLAGRASDDETVRMQEAILDDLAKLIAQRPGAAEPPDAPSGGAEQEEPGDGNGGDGGDAAADAGDAAALEAVERLDEVEGDVEADLEARRNLLRRAWGHLPERVQAQLHQAGSDRFLPGYERLIERYFERLAEESRP